MIAQFNRFDFEMPIEAVAACHHSGSCDKDVAKWHPVIELSHIPDDKLAEELREMGTWTEEQLKDRKQNEQRIIWIAAGNIQDEKG